jgi:hypothetical protein
MKKQIVLCSPAMRFKDTKESSNQLAPRIKKCVAWCSFDLASLQIVAKTIFDICKWHSVNDAVVDSFSDGFKPLEKNL